MAFQPPPQLVSTNTAKIDSTNRPTIRFIADLPNGIHSRRPIRADQFRLLQNRERCLSIASARYDQVEKLVGLCWIEASQFPDGIQGSWPVAGSVVNEPEVVPIVGIVRIDPHNLA